MSAATCLIFSAASLGAALAAPLVASKTVYGADCGAAAFAAGVNPFSAEGKAATAAAQK